MAKRFEKSSLSFKILSTFEANASVYNCLFLGLVISFALLSFFLKNFDFFNISLDNLNEIEEEILATSACLFFLKDLILLIGLLIIILKVNFDAIFCLNILLSLTLSESHSGL